MVNIVKKLFSVLVSIGVVPEDRRVCSIVLVYVRKRVRIIILSVVACSRSQFGDDPRGSQKG